MASKRDFLLEIGSEELPSAPLMSAEEQLGKLFAKGLDELGLAHGEVETMSSPRRLTVRVRDVADATEALHQVFRGPAAKIAFDADGNPTKAALGFARGKGLDVSALERREDADGKEYVFAEVNVPSKDARPLLSELCERTIGALSFPRSQRWGSEHVTYCRPVRWIVCLLGDEVVPVSYGDVTSSNVTRTHRVLGSGDVVVSDPASYERTLEEGHVLLAKRRREVIREGIAKVEQERGGAHVDTPKAVFDEVVNLCEWPTVLVGRFDEEFLEVPHEIICESMLSNQRYFPIYDASGELTREFVIVSNADPTCSDTVVAGNERVVRARLDDAKFFYEEDLKVPLETFVSKLDTVVFQEKLGTVRQKVGRIEMLAAECSRELGLDAPTAALAVRAAHLCKADLVSQAVIEFTNQQGVMGGYYALAAGEDPQVADAIREHYRPRFASDELPSGIVGKVVAVSDKLDTICGMFAIDEPPTGSSDPFAVRRAAIGIIQIMREEPKLVLRRLIGTSLDAYAAQGLEFDEEDVARKVVRFFLGRLATIARGEDAKPDTVDAVSAVGVIDPAKFLARVHALDEARENDPELFDDLATAFARASHLADPKLGDEVDESMLGEPERVLLEACRDGASKVRAALADSDYKAALEALAGLRAPIDRFFEDVLVMDDDEGVRNNRLRLLNRFSEVFEGVADIGALARKK
ncbi:MAG: glycine--tRNA ligase subunit beta [Atopobiaceae bacterium]|jgi:glycyl-tRNA synthetase beta chain|nr:glycine--tRNA ligase subunit beta [Atopobiaceae bacterium]MCH4119233.1 glycine--tRNA ligase subunit beta [Atopobiaceae bacterium]MCI1317986.1 glycine--tRNA ligase subunit beta [Atopobiaceae bacterium]MCI1388507.1 glycine--tRNA ligase subunit beta [Atopobiaceae bacterium]MCI1432006.1 glycine--tRNA ligase subunit beta [Atopobiaceae bacterium]